ncbi:MAG: hypothetical protein AAB225_28165 [Acidobacteriota bacterium]
MVVEIEGVPLHLAHPDEIPIRWVGQEEVMRQLLAAWMVIAPQDLPMIPRLSCRASRRPGSLGAVRRGLTHRPSTVRPRSRQG